MPAAAAISFMLKGLTGPVVLVGAQRSSDRPSSDAALNLTSAATVASKTDLGEVVAVMHKETSDTISAIHRGAKVRKFHTSRRDAFKSVNDIPLGIVDKSKVKFNKEYRKKTKGKVVVDDKIESDVAMIYSYPGLNPEDIPERKGIPRRGLRPSFQELRLSLNRKTSVGKGLFKRRDIRPGIIKPDGCRVFFRVRFNL